MVSLRVDVSYDFAYTSSLRLHVVTHRCCEVVLGLTSLWHSSVSKGWHREPNEVAASRFAPDERNDTRLECVPRYAFNPLVKGSLEQTEARGCVQYQGFPSGGHFHRHSNSM
nr:hypothetical protein CFP56_76751 [Quercus suber]